MNYIDIIQTLLLVAVIVILLRQSPLSVGRKKKKLVLDSCALIDGRIVELVKAGFIQDDLVVPRFVLKELQLLADGKDSQKRERARFGLDIANKLQSINIVDVSIDPSIFPQADKIDDKLILLAKKLPADLYTTDYNLNKVATVEDVRVLNINELALTMRPLILPGENKKVKIVQKGSGKGQGVGYLEDGTMVVVERSDRLIGKTVEVEVARYHQTESGKMIFANAISRKNNN